MRNLFFIVPLFLIAGCAQPTSQEQAEPQASPTGYSIASPEYVDIAKQSFQQLAAFEFDAWGEHLADDVEYYFPDGDPDTRTKLIGKEAVLGWWKDWRNTSGVVSMSMGSENVIPIHADNTQATTGMDGTFILAWMTTKLTFDNGNSTSLRMNMDLHFNDAKKIDRVFTYYDRTGIIKAMGINILDSTDESG